MTRHDEVADLVFAGRDRVSVGTGLRSCPSVETYLRMQPGTSVVIGEKRHARAASARVIQAGERHHALR